MLKIYRNLKYNFKLCVSDYCQSCNLFNMLKNLNKKNNIYLNNRLDFQTFMLQ